MLGRQPIIPNEDPCWQSFLQGDENSFTYFHRLHYNDLYFYGLKIVSDEDQVKNAIQELFLHLWKNRQCLDPVHSVKHYLLSAFRRHLYRLLDKEKQQKRFAHSSEANRFAFSAEDIIVEQETETLTRSLLAQALNQLPPATGGGLPALHLGSHPRRNCHAVTGQLPIGRQYAGPRDSRVTEADGLRAVRNRRGFAPPLSDVRLVRLFTTYFTILLTLICF